MPKLWQAVRSAIIGGRASEPEYVINVERVADPGERETTAVFRMYLRYEPSQKSVVTDFLGAAKIQELTDLELLQLMQIIIEDRIRVMSAGSTGE